MGISKKYKVGLDIKTPVHIGSGNLFASSEYIVDTAKIKRNGKIEEETVVRKIDTPRFYASLSRTEKEAFIEAMKDLKFSLNQPKFNSIPDNLDFKEKFSNENLRKYRQDTYKAKWETRPDVKKDIECAVKTDSQLYIPGSSIKGAVRAALFYDSINPEDIPEIMHHVSKEEFNRPVEMTFSSDSMENSSADSMENSSQASIMRFLHIADSIPSKLIPTIYEVMPYTLSKPTRNNRKPFKKSSFAKRYLECIPETNLSTVLTTNFSNAFYDKLEFGDEIKRMLKIKSIQTALFNFADDLIDFEIAYCRKNRLNELADSYNALLDYNEFNSPLILLGSTTGFHSKSIYLKIKKYDDEFGTGYLKDLEKHLEFKFPKADFPKTRRCTQVDKKPLGWVKLKFKKLN